MGPGGRDPQSSHPSHTSHWDRVQASMCQERGIVSENVGVSYVDGQVLRYLAAAEAKGHPGSLRSWPLVLSTVSRQGTQPFKTVASFIKLQ